MPPSGPFNEYKASYFRRNGEYTIIHPSRILRARHICGNIAHPDSQVVGEDEQKWWYLLNRKWRGRREVSIRLITWKRMLTHSRFRDTGAYAEHVNDSGRRFLRGLNKYLKGPLNISSATTSPIADSFLTARIHWAL